MSNFTPLSLISNQYPTFLSLLILSLLIACTEEKESSSLNLDSQVIGFRSLFQDYVKPNCSQEACHGGNRGIVGLRLVEVDEAYEHLINQDPTNASAFEQGMKRVDPTHLENSYLWHKLSHSSDHLSSLGLGSAMPPSGNLSAGEKTLNLVKTWIEGGAPLEGLSANELGQSFDQKDHLDEELYIQCDLGQNPSELDMHRCFPPVSDEHTMRLYTPKITIPPQSEVLICSYLDMPIEEPIYLNRTLGRQMLGGHHAAVFLAVTPSDEAPHECRDDEMSNFRFAAGAGGGGGQDTQLPPGVALKIEPGQQFVIQSHYLNPTDQSVEVMDAVDLVPIAEDDVHSRVDPFALIHSGFEVPVGGEPFEVRKKCRLESDIDVYMLLGHTHDYGVLFEFYHHTPMLETPRKLYQATDGPLLRDNPEIKYFDPPLPFKAGDEVEMRCVWENTTDVPLGWPEEMCVALMYYGPGAGWMTCDDGDETPKLPSANTGQGCVPNDYPGNELGVGQACTAEGGECADHERARLCLATFDARANFCSYLGCQSDEECGANATCLAQGPGTACVPNMCAD